MTTERDHGSRELKMLRCELRGSHLYPRLELALRDMRQANDRDPTTGTGDGNESWIGLSLAMIVLDTLSGDDTMWVIDGAPADTYQPLAGRREDRVRTPLLPAARLRAAEADEERRPEGIALPTTAPLTQLDTSRPGQALVSVPVFCGRLVERIAAEAPGDWDDSLIDTDYRL